MIEAQRLYADAERIFGSNADAVLGMYESGQEPRKFFDGVKTAYLSGKMGSRAALENSGVAAFLTDEQRSLAYELGVQQNGVPELVSTNEKPYISSLDQKKDIRKGHLAKSEEFATIRDKDMVILEERLLELPIQERMEELDEVLRFYTDRKSGWKGITYISPVEQMGDTTGRKNWDCSIELREDAGIKTPIHELLHARLISFWNRLAYSRWENAEEAAVELFARKICEKNGVNYKPAYSKIVGQLEIAGRILYPNRDQYEFAKAFFEQDVINRYSWLREQADILISKGVLSEKTIDILNTAIDTFKRRI